MSFKMTVIRHAGIPYQYIAALLGTMQVVTTGMLVAWSTPSLPQLLSPDSAITMTTSDGSWLAVIPYLGSFIGCYFAAVIVDIIGRKKCILICSPLYFTSWMMIAFATEKYFLFGARLVSGVADGVVYTLIPMYMGEIADPKIRGLICSYISTANRTGFLIISVIGSRFTIQNTAFISSVLPIVHFIVFCFMPESPYYSLMKSRPEEATRDLIKLRGRLNVAEEINRLSKGVQEARENESRLLDLIRVKSNRKAAIIVIGMRGFQQFCGALAISFYATIIFAQAGTDLAPDTCSSIYFTIQIICGIICSCLVDKVGRRPLLMISVTGSFLTLALLGIYFSLKDWTSMNLESYTWMPLVLLLLFNCAYSIGLGVIPVVLLGELFHTSVKAYALCLADIYFGTVVILSTKFLQIMNDYMGMSIPFFVFAGFCIATILFVHFCVPETKGKTLEEIQVHLRGSDNI